MHLGHDEETSKPEAEHLPEIGSITQRHQCSMDQGQHFLCQHPPTIYVHASEEEASLQEQQEHVKKSEQMSRRADHRVVPERIDRCPREIVTVILSEATSGLCYHAATDLPAEEETAALILHQKNDHKQQNHRPLGTLFRNVQSQTIIEDVCLDEVQPDEAGVSDKSQNVDSAQGVAVNAAL